MLINFNMKKELKKKKDESLVNTFFLLKQIKVRLGCAKNIG